MDNEQTGTQVPITEDSNPISATHLRTIFIEE